MKRVKDRVTEPLNCCTCRLCNVDVVFDEKIGLRRDGSNAPGQISDGSEDLGRQCMDHMHVAYVQIGRHAGQGELGLSVQKPTDWILCPKRGKRQLTVLKNGRL